MSANDEVRIKTHDRGIEIGLPLVQGRATRLPLADWSTSTIASLTRQSRRCLETLDYLHGEALLEELDDGSYRLPFRHLPALDEFDRRVLGIPVDVQPTIHVAADGFIGASDFSLAVEVTDQVLGPLEGRFDRFDGVYLSPSGLVPLPPEANALLEACDALNASSDLAEQLGLLAEVKIKAEQAGATLDSYLADEQVFIADGLDIDVSISSNREAQVSPQFGEHIPDAATERLARTKRPGRVVSAQTNDNRRVRVILDQEDIEAVEAVRGLGDVTGADVPRLLVEPERVLGDTLDLTRYSPRVRGFLPKVKQARARLAFKPTKRDWFNLEASFAVNDLPVAEGIDLSGATSSTVEATDAVQEPITATTDKSPGKAESDDMSFDSVSRLAADAANDFIETEDGWLKVDKENVKQVRAAKEKIESEFPEGIPLRHMPYVLDVISNLHDLEFVDLPPEVEELVKPKVDTRLPESLRLELHPYQVAGYEWLWRIANWPLRPGAMLADEMGLGKTAQVITLLARLQEEGRLAPALVVLPGSLIDKWIEEFEKFCPRLLPVVEHHGPNRSSQADVLASQQLVITTYEILRADQLLLGQVDWQVLVCDESQRVKNPAAGVTRAVKALKAGKRVTMTGTPVENNLSELWCQMDLLLPGFLGSDSEFRAKWAKSIENPEVVEPLRQERAEDLRQTIQPHYLRRLKSEVLEGLPSISFNRDEVPMSSLQTERYETRRQTARGASIGIRLALLQELIQLCSHPRAMEDEFPDSEQLVSECPKLGWVVDYIMHQVRPEGEKVLLFSRYKRIQRILKQVISELVGGPSFPPLNGDVDVRNRLEYVRRFNSHDGFAAMVLSPEATGVGLDLVGANHVVHYTRLWNPAKEAQATARTHRISQTRPVHVQYPITVCSAFTSVEVHLDRLLQDKQQLAEDVIWPTSKLNVERELADAAFEDVPDTEP